MKYGAIHRINRSDVSMRVKQDICNSCPVAAATCSGVSPKLLNGLDQTPLQTSHDRRSEPA